VNERGCRRCGRLTWSPHSPYCREHRPPPEVRAQWVTKTRATRGYGQAHKAMRERYGALVRSGSVACARCGEPIESGEGVDLDHTDDRARYLGPSHVKCNRGHRKRDDEGRRVSRRW
jgi:hypothetical protein